LSKVSLFIIMYSNYIFAHKTQLPRAVVDETHFSLSAPLHAEKSNNIIYYNIRILYSI